MCIGGSLKGSCLASYHALLFCFRKFHGCDRAQRFGSFMLRMPLLELNLWLVTHRLQQNTFSVSAS
jgi:hypothetical protein